MMLSLMRSTRIVAYGFGGGYEPGMTSDTGLELGQALDFDYALRAASRRLARRPPCTATAWRSTIR